MAAIITGAGRGIGREIAVTFAAEGAKVALVSRTKSQLTETGDLIAKTGGTSLVVPTDVTDKEAVSAMVAKVIAELGPIDVLLNNAGSFNTIGPGLVRTEMTELQLNTEAGKRWMPGIKNAFDEKKDVPPTFAARLAVNLASGRCDELHGRAFQSGEDLDIALAAKERIIDEDLKTLRMRELS